MRCETCQEEATVHVEAIGCHFCESCVKKIDQRIKEMNMAKPCENCDGLGHVDSGGLSPWGAPINLPCPACAGNWLELASWGASWKRNSSLEKWFPLTAEELTKLKTELKECKRHRDEWLWCYSLVVSTLKADPGWETAKEFSDFGSGLVPLEGATLAKKLRAELQNLTELNLEKFTTINAYYRMASLDKWRVRKLADAIDRYLSADGYRDASAILTEARADAVNAKPQHYIPGAPLVDAELDEKREPAGLLKQYALHVSDDDVDREYCTGYNHGLVMAEAFIEEENLHK